MMQYVRPFGQLQGQASVNLTVTGTTANVAVPVSGIGFRSVRIVNSGTQAVSLEFGKSNAVTAVISTSILMLANSAEVFLLPPDITYIAAIAASTGSTLNITVGEGI